MTDINELRRLYEAAIENMMAFPDRSVDFYQHYCVSMHNALPALLAELEKLRGVSCAICHDTGYLDASQGWDVGQEASECPYCPARVDALRARLEVLEKEKARLRLALATVAHNTMDPCITGIAVNALEETR